MNRLRGTKCYLVGPIEMDASPDGWRNQITVQLENLGIKVYDPLKKPSWAPKLTVMNKDNFLRDINVDPITEEATESHNAMHWIRNIDRRFVMDADFIIYYAPKTFSAGSGEEITIASNMNKPILVFNNESDLIPSSWLACMLCKSAEEIKDTFFKNASDIIEYIKKVNNNEIEIDPFKWVFLSYFFGDTKVKNVKYNF